MRLLTIGDNSYGVERVIESHWTDLEGESRAQALVRGDDSPFVWIKTDTGVVGALPISFRAPITFTDGDGPSERRGTIIAASGKTADEFPAG